MRRRMLTPYQALALGFAVSTPTPKTLAFVPASPLNLVHTLMRQNTFLPKEGRSRILSPSSITCLRAASAEEIHAREVFSIVDADTSGAIDATELGEMLRMLDLDAKQSDADALFKYLDSEGTGAIKFDDFAPWYAEAISAAEVISETVRSNIIGRRTISMFDQTPVSDETFRRAIECAIAAPNQSMSEPWRFIKIGSETVKEIARMNTDILMDSGLWEAAGAKQLRLLSIPGWCVVTSKLTPGDPQAEEEDFAATCCAMQNFMLSMWSEGIGTKWMRGPVTKTPEFAKLCGINTEEEKFVGCIWYGFASGGLTNTTPWQRKKSINDVLDIVP